MPLILLHGNGEDMSYFAHQIAYFKRDYRVIAVDTRGHGQSPRGTAPFTISQFADDLLVLLDCLAVETAILLGFSDGGNIALTFALRHPERVARLILNGANLNPRGVKARVQLPIELGYRIALLFAKRSDEARHHSELLALMVKEPSIQPEQLASLYVPTLVLTGTRDMIRDRHSKCIAENLPVAEWRRIPGSHFIAQKNPEVYNRAVAEFLAKELPQ